MHNQLKSALNLNWVYGVQAWRCFYINRKIYKKKLEQINDNDWSMSMILDPIYALF